MGGNKKTTRLYQRVTNTIARDIRAGKFVPGQRLPAERHLARRFEVSRPTIREAIIALELIGLVDVRKGSGVYVRANDDVEPDVAELDIGPFELIEARSLLECEIAALAAELVDEEQLAGLKNILTDMQAENEQDVTGELADREFHLSIARITKNSAIVGALEYLWDVRYHSPLCIRLMNEVRATGIKPIIKEHQAIIDAIGSGDSERAKAAMRKHLAGVTEGLLAVTEVEVMQQAHDEIEKHRKRYVSRIVSK